MSIQNNENMDEYLQRIQVDNFDSDSDSDSNDSSDSDSYDVNLMTRRFKLVLPELYSSQRFGTKNYLKTHFIAVLILKYNPRNISVYFRDVNVLSRFYRDNLWKNYSRNLYTPGTPVRNWVNIIKRPDCYDVQLAECIRLPTGETVCVIKTFWLRIIQRTWKKVFKERKRILQNIHLRQIRGKVFMPSLKGMLYGV